MEKIFIYIYSAHRLDRRIYWIIHWKCQYLISTNNKTLAATSVALLNPLQVIQNLTTSSGCHT